jgi:hypothetical protein
VRRRRTREHEHRQRNEQQLRARNDADDSDAALPPAREFVEVFLVDLVAPHAAL